MGQQEKIKYVDWALLFLVLGICRHFIDPDRSNPILTVAFLCLEFRPPTGHWTAARPVSLFGDCFILVHR